jgi:hypothetical protein
VNSIWVTGSSASKNRPVLIVTYSVGPDAPGNLTPNGGDVSVAKPILAYAGDEDTTQQKIEFSNDGGVTVSFTADWHVPDGTFRYDPANHVGSPALTSGGADIWWRVSTRGADGTVVTSTWATYGYTTLPAAPTFTSPVANPTDGTPTLQWTPPAGQTSVQAALYRGDTLLDSLPWTNDSALSAWTPGKGVAVPGGNGRFEWEMRDSVKPRVAAEGAPTTVKATVNFTTTSTGAGTGIDAITATYAEPVPVLTGTRTVGMPDEVSLFRDGVQVTIWDPATGEPYKWAPASLFFVGTAFTIRDYTAPLRGSHTWTVRVRVNGTLQATGPSYTATYEATSLWLVNPRTDERVEVCGQDGVPVVEMQADENVILQTPINGGPVVETKRRRITRSTKYGTITGAAMGTGVDVLHDWAENEHAAERYRMIYGRVNWPVILGDYNPVELITYKSETGPDRVNMTCSWFERLTDF